MPIAVLRWPDKDPADVLDYALDFTDFLAQSDPDDTISSVIWTVPAGLTAGVQTVLGALAIAWLSGGTAGVNYAITCRMVTAGGRTIERNVQLYVREI